MKEGRNLLRIILTLENNAPLWLRIHGIQLGLMANLHCRFDMRVNQYPRLMSHPNLISFRVVSEINAGSNRYVYQPLMFWSFLAILGKLIGAVALVYTVAVALYTISEQLEEHVGLAKRYITRYIQAVMALHVLLWLGDGLPLWRSLWSLATNYIYLMVMRSFPVVTLSNPSFLAACFGALSSHFVWFRYFASDELPSYKIYEHHPNYSGATAPPFAYIASFFGLLVWTVPFLLFLSLSANDNVLPTVNDTSKPVHRKGLARQSVDQVLKWSDETLTAFGFKSHRAQNLPM